MAQIHKNKVHLAGDLAKDPVTRLTPTGKRISNLTIATKHKQWTEYHRVVCWEQLADKAKELTGGEFVQVVGRLQTRSWNDKENSQKKYATEIIAWQLVVPGKDPATKNDHGLEVTDDDVPF